MDWSKFGFYFFWSVTLLTWGLTLVGWVSEELLEKMFDIYPRTSGIHPPPQAVLYAAPAMALLFSWLLKKKD